MVIFQIGSIIGRFWKLAKFLWLNICKSAKFGLAGIWKSVKKVFHWLMKLDWLKIFKCVKLIIEIIKQTRSLLFCKQTAHFIQVAG